MTEAIEMTEAIDERSDVARRGSRRPVVVAILSLVVALAASGFAGYLWLETQDLKDEQASLSARVGSEVISLEINVSSVSSDVSSLSGAVSSLTGSVRTLEDEVGDTSGYDTLTSRLDDVERATSSVQSDIDFLASSGGSAYTDELIANSIDDLRSCVNDYMQTVGDAGGGRYSYYFC